MGMVFSDTTGSHLGASLFSEENAKDFTPRYRIGTARFEKHHEVDHMDQAVEREWTLVRHTPALDFVSYNVSPTQSVPVIRRDSGGAREAVLLHGIAPKYSTIPSSPISST
jgi:hypothetical protein